MSPGSSVVVVVVVVVVAAVVVVEAGCGGCCDDQDQASSSAHLWHAPTLLPSRAVRWCQCQARVETLHDCISTCKCLCIVYIPEK